MEQNNRMKNTADTLRDIISNSLPLLTALAEEDSSIQPLNGKWTKKQILGHLVDSASNNQHKFVRMMSQSHLEFVGYEQDHWVDSQKYNSIKWIDLVKFWSAFNLHLAHVIENVQEERLSNTISIDQKGPFTLEFIMNDYNEHLKHHLKQILPSADFESSFENIY